MATGQWALDPAYAVSQNLRFPEPVSTEYTFNPYLGVEAHPSSLAGGAGEMQAAQ